MKALKRQFMRPVMLGAALILGSGQALAADDSQWESGEQIYAKVCGHCHEAGVGPTIKGRSLPPSYITAIVRHGFRAMPAFRASFIDDQALQSVAEYISTSPAPQNEE
ncbi:c-type cytochrome [Marinobacterium marinum]|uniref:Cytochrome c n=1 Tax=Marinobacterium marinum TaxID=2756129 RepID=A0A7W1WWZ6_9GAMM|nr:cytochrome c [Marinobacterium marinum]MBA4501591.1 cytochrome c [Marinobacterium marinum]